MTLPAKASDRLQVLLAAMLDERLSDDQASDLRLLLRDNPAAQREYVRHAVTHAMLQWAIALPEAGLGRNIQEKDGSEIDDRKTENKNNGLLIQASPPSPVPGFFGSAAHATVGCLSSGWPVAYLIATVICGIGLLVGARIYVSQPGLIVEQSPPARKVMLASETKMQFVGRITGMVDCSWADPQTEAIYGAYVPLGRKYALASGLLEITYDTGAKVILQGPVTFEIESFAGGYLSVGKLTGKVETKEAKGFAVRTPTAVVTDLGTEFGVEVDKQGSMASYVFRGVVEVQRTDGNGAKVGLVARLKDNESMRVDRAVDGATMKRAAIDPATFVRAEQLPKLTEAQRRTPLHRWQAYSRMLRNDPALVAYYTFESFGINSSTLPNLSSAGRALDGRVEGAEWVYGRLPGKYALYFHGPGSSDKVVLPEQERFRFTGAFSVAAWFKVGWLKTPGCQVLVAKGETSWLLERDEHTNNIVFDTRYQTTAARPPFHLTRGQSDITDDRWHLAVGVYEPVANMARKRLYIDGRLDAQSTTALPLHQNKDPIWLGDNNEVPGRMFCGCIDEVAILARALSADDITVMFEAGRPTDSFVRQPRSNMREQAMEK